jgi:hypothetical protein
MPRRNASSAASWFSNRMRWRIASSSCKRWRSRAATWAAKLAIAGLSRSIWIAIVGS